MIEARPYHVLVEVDRSRFHSRLREIEAWLAEWEIDAEIGSVLGAAGQLRILFADERAAYAFQRCHGGVAAPVDEIATAQAADAADEDLYDRLAARISRLISSYGRAPEPLAFDRGRPVRSSISRCCCDAGPSAMPSTPSAVQRWLGGEPHTRGS